MYAVFLIIAIVLCLWGSERINLRCSIILTMTMITTFSTAGYISLVCIWGVYIIYALSRKENIGKSQKRLLIVALILAVIVFSYLLATGRLGNRAYVIYKLFDARKNATGTVFERTRAINLVIDMIRQGFPIGVGNGVFAEKFLEGNILTATVLNWIAIYGIAYGVIMATMLVFSIKCLAKGKAKTLFIFIALLPILFAQDLSASFACGIPIFYGFRSLSRKLWMT